MREPLEEGGSLAGGVAGRLLDTQRIDGLVRSVEPETLTRQPALLLAGEKHRPRRPQEPILGPGPVEPFFEVLARVSALEPGIEHPVGKDETRGRRAAPRTPSGEAVVLPQPVGQHAVEIVAADAQPRRERGRVLVHAAATRPERVHRERQAAVEPARARSVGGDRLRVVADPHEGRADLPHGFRDPARTRVERGGDLQDTHTGQSTNPLSRRKYFISSTGSVEIGLAGTPPYSVPGSVNALLSSDLAPSTL